MKGIPNTYLSAGALGAAWGLAEAAGVLLYGRDFVDRPVLLVGVSLLGAVLLALPGALVSRERGWLGALVVLLGLEAFLAIVTDPPPFQEGAWYVGSPLASVLTVVGLAVMREVLQRAPQRLGLVLAGFVVLWGVRPRAGVPQPPPGQGTSVLLITLDTTRADHCSLYGYGRPTTPNLDALGSRGTVFDAAWSPIPVTGPAHATLLSGQGTWEHGMLLNGTPLPELPWLPERFHERGYRTAAFVGAYVLDGRYGFDRGFQVYDDDFAVVAGTSSILPMRLWSGMLRRLRPDALIERRGDRTAERAMAWMDQADGPTFVWVHLFDPHGPYTATEGPSFFEGAADSSLSDLEGLPVYLAESLEAFSDTDQVVAEYDREVHFADQQIGRLVEAAGPDTLVVVVGDHGESFGEGGIWFDHGSDLWDHSLRVPLVMAGAGVPVERRGDLVELGAVPGLIEAALEGGLPDTQPAIARSLAYDRLANQAARQKDPTLHPSARMAGIRGPEGLIVVHETGGTEWFGEGAEAPPERVQAGRDLLSGQPVERLLSEDEQRLLEALGYVDGLH